MSHLYVGQRGSGKSFMAMVDLLEDDGYYIYTNDPAIKANEEKINAYLAAKKLPPKIIKLWSSWYELEGAHCGVIHIDECQNWIDARKYEMLSPTAKKMLTDERKDDNMQIDIAPLLRQVDVLFASLVQEVRLLDEMKSWPFIGWIWPNSVRPPIVCKHTEIEEHLTRDGRGDQYTTLRRWFGFGSILKYHVVDPAILLGQRSSDGSMLPEEAIRRNGFKIYDQRIADLYDTGSKVSENAPRLQMRRKRNLEEKKLPPPKFPGEGGTPVTQLSL